MAGNLSFSVAHLAAIQLPFSLVNSDTKKAQAMGLGVLTFNVFVECIRTLSVRSQSSRLGVVLYPF